MSARYCVFGPLNLHLLNLYLCYFLMFWVSFCILVFCRSLRKNDGIYVKLQRSGKLKCIKDAEYDKCAWIFFYSKLELGGGTCAVPD
jgi:hypothetical protein